MFTEEGENAITCDMEKYKTKITPSRIKNNARGKTGVAIDTFETELR